MPRAVKALAARAAAYQLRKAPSNACCIAVCPIALVSLAGALGMLLLSLLEKATNNIDVLSCSNVQATDAYGFPIWKPDEPGVPFQPSDPPLYKVNYAYVEAFRNTGPPGAAVFNFKHPCSFWYGSDYPTAPNATYEPPVFAETPILLRDAFFAAQPPGGWIPTILQALFKTSIDSLTLAIFQNNQQHAWALYAADPSVDPSAVGALPQRPAVQISDLAQMPPPPLVSPANASTGLLGTIPPRYYLNFPPLEGFSKNLNFTQVPFYVPTGSKSADLDDAIAERINTIVSRIAALDKSSLLNGNVNGDVNSLFSRISQILTDLPHGAIYFNTIDHTNKKYNFTFHYGKDKRLSASSNLPGPGSRALTQLTQLDNAILRNSNPQKLGEWTITQGYRVFPFIYNTKIKFQFGSLIGLFLYPFGVSFLLPIFVITLVQEKESRILVMMKMNGLKEYAYYISHYITFLILFTISTLLFVFTGYFWKLSLFTLTDPVVLFIAFFLWGNVQIALAFFLTTLFNKSRIALLITFLLVLSSTIISQAFTQLFREKQCPYAFFIWPPFAFFRALVLLNVRSWSSDFSPYKLSDIVPGDEVFATFMFMSVQIPVFFLLAAYLNAVFPSEFGVRRPWHFPVTDLVAWFRQSTDLASGKNGVQSEAALALSIKVDENETRFEDADVKAERERIDKNNFDPKSPLIVKHMRKVYAGRGGAGPKLAVKDVTFAVEQGIVFGLLGPNGAGKTTLISILTGLYEASSGQGTLGGYDIKQDTDQVYKRLGICPQFDILWEDLTVGEHLFFYARLKGIPANQLRSAIDTALAGVSLTNFENRLSKGLSGGEKRRLSIAIALLGNPAVVFLDEPTTGLDPEVRRLIWTIVNNAREGKTIVLTTHSMEEAEALCQRIGIMAKGTLRCIANPTRLKQLYGSGFKLYMNTLEQDTPRACAFVESILPTGWTKVDAFATNTSYEFPPVSGILSRLFKEIEDAKQSVGILDWGIGQTTLEEVFIRLINDDDAGAEY